MILPYELIVEIAMCGWSAYKVLAIADKMLWGLLQNVNLKHHFSGEIDIYEDATDYLNDYYMCYKIYEYPTYYSAHVMINSITRTIMYTKDEDMCTIIHLRRYKKVDSKYYREFVYFNGNKIEKIKRSIIEDGKLMVSERWNLEDRVYEYYNYSNKDRRTWATGNGMPEGGWRLTYPKFFIYSNES
jgi:hypothetical protein